MNQYYAVVAKSELFGQIALNREQWFRQVFIYAMPYPRGPASADTETLKSLVKLVFLGHMRYELGVDFIQGGSQLTTTFFDTWWTLYHCNDELLNDLLERMDASDVVSIRDNFSAEQLQRIDECLNYQEPDTVVADVRDAIRVAVWGSSDCRREIIDAIVQRHAQAHNPDLLELAVTLLVDQALMEHQLEQAQWPIVTDCDKLERAFSELSTYGILARHHAPCCGTCGASVVGEEIAALTAEGKGIRGYTFYDEQDTDGAINGGELYLSYGSCDEDAVSSLSIANQVKHSLEAHGLNVRWDGTIDSRIGVALQWRRRRSVDGGNIATEQPHAPEPPVRTV